LDRSEHYAEFLIDTGVNSGFNPKYNGKSVRLSVTFWYCIKTNVHIVKLIPPSGREMTLVFIECSRRFKISLGRLKYTAGGKNLHFFD